MINKSFTNASSRPRYMMGVMIEPGETKEVRGDQKALDGHGYVKRNWLVPADSTKAKGSSKPAADKQADAE